MYQQYLSYKEELESVIKELIETQDELVIPLGISFRSEQLNKKFLVLKL